jgi:16S rRNA (guanine966-N2)-methyltransferase
MLLHAPWGGRATAPPAPARRCRRSRPAHARPRSARGAAHATFVEQDRAARTVLRANIAACRAADRSTMIAGDVLALPAGPVCGLVFLDPPYGQGLVARALAALRKAGRVAPGAVIVAETGRDEVRPGPQDVLAERAHGAARLTIWRE